jgi:3-isopropylmalate/(R)-2-methylmalate dehydratase small subunit
VKPFTELTSHVAPLLADDVDTDQIIPARFLKVTDRSGLAEGLFAEWRKDPDFVLHRPEVEGAQILLAGQNFGCGSSREHAPWALLAGGFRCVIARSFADIFRNNALKNGLLPVALDDAAHAALRAAVEADPRVEVRVDLRALRLEHPGGEASFHVEPFARDCLLSGVDQLGHLLSHQDAIAAFEARRGDQA